MHGLIVLDPGAEFLSVDNLPKVVSVSFCTSMFSYDSLGLIDTFHIWPVVRERGKNYFYNTCDGHKLWSYFSDRARRGTR
jgi:hypothetical protein